MERMTFVKKAEEQKKEGKIFEYFLDPFFYEAEYLGGRSVLQKKLLENLNLPKNAREGITKIRIIVDKDGFGKPEILQYNDKRVKIALIESIDNMERWVLGQLMGSWYPYKVDLSLTVKSEKNI
jgi:hypothetical protein